MAMLAERRLLLQAAVAFLALPGVVAFVLPLWLLRPVKPATGFAAPGLLVATLGLAVLGWCVREFFVSGGGTLAPWTPPRRLVTTGLYRFSRNPMYLGVLLILVGWALAFRSPGLGQYAALMAVAFHLRVLLAEEPWLARTFGAEWRGYSDRVPRWLGSGPGASWRAIAARLRSHPSRPRRRVNPPRERPDERPAPTRPGRSPSR